MVDFLTSVDSDGGPREPIPVTLVSGGQELSRFSISPFRSAGTDRSVSASTTSAQLMATNASRSGFYIKNDSAIDVWINLGSAAVASAGNGNMKIAANGGYYESAPGFVTTSAINIIASSGTPAITAREF